MTPIADDAFDAVPREIAHDAVAASEWRRLVPVLRHARVDLDRDALLAACQTWSLYERKRLQYEQATKGTSSS